MTTAKVTCRTPTPGKAPTNIPAWKFDIVRKAILDTLDSAADGVQFRDLAGSVSQVLTPANRSRLGSVGWHTTTVKLELEVRGEIERLPGVRPQRLRKAK